MSSPAIPNKPLPTTTPNQAPSTACAACKYQRRKCIPECTLAPYFPAESHRQFLNAHRLFGVSNMLKIVRGLDPIRRSEAMQSIIFQSDVRAMDPVGGCYRIVLHLQSQIEQAAAELADVLRHLAFYRAQSQAPVVEQQVIPQQQQPYFDYFCFDGGGVDGDENKNNSGNSHSNSNSINNYNSDNPNLEIEVHDQCGIVEDEAKPLADFFDDAPEFGMVNEDVDSKKLLLLGLSLEG